MGLIDFLRGLCCREVSELRMRIVELEQERIRDLHSLVDIAGVNALFIGNTGPRLWPELMADFKEMARLKHATVLIVEGHGVYPVPE